MMMAPRPRSGGSMADGRFMASKTELMCTSPPLLIVIIVVIILMGELVNRI